MYIDVTEYKIYYTDRICYTVMIKLDKEIREEYIEIKKYLLSMVDSYLCSKGLDS